MIYEKGNNMKKTLCATLAAVLCISLVSCANVEELDFKEKVDKSNSSLKNETTEFPQRLPVITDVETVAPEITEQPIITEAPAVTEPPVVTETPAVTEPPVVTEAPAPTANDAQIYNSYLKSGRLAKLINDSYMNENDVEIESYLDDLNGDGVRELLLKITDLRSMGVRGNAYGTYLFTIVNGTPVLLTDEYYGGGSMAGPSLCIVTDQATGMRLAARGGYFRDGYYFNEGSVTPYKIEGGSIQAITVIGYGRITDDNMGSSYIQKVKSETNVYQIKDGELLYFQIDGRYVDEAEYDSSIDRYKDYFYTPTKGTLKNPLGL